MLWKGFQKPKRLECIRESLSSTFGEFYAQPFERGWGTTVGNALRRVLLSSLEGAAITAVKIEGVLHEFSSLPGVHEDTTDIILNLKAIPLKINVDHPETIYLRVDGPREVTAADIETSANVEVLDPNVHVANLSEEGRLSIEMRVKPGRGYVPADRNFDPDLEIGYVPVDSVHSPVKKVNYIVDAARVGQATDYDKLSLQVWTNGSVPPQDAVALAAKLLKDHLSIFINFEEQTESLEDDRTPEDERLADYFGRSVDELELSVRSYNCLKNAGIRTIGELVQKSESEMLKTKNFGRKSLNEIKDILQSMNLDFGMKIDDRRLKRVLPAPAGTAEDSAPTTPATT
ncbi:MAG TPA: DNA-directed RNA polymerase subunit alpha [Candidatus Saccharimonadales bacterium]|nr:DNA-directed RNA polymerase subunit alpha [Candidatus Saccharimonadales bacterium]